METFGQRSRSVSPKGVGRSMMGKKLTRARTEIRRKRKSDDSGDSWYRRIFSCFTTSSVEKDKGE